jgi:type IV pilus assembly protein PilA
VVAIIGILAAIAIPNFIRFQARSKQGEAKANLKALFTAERSMYQEKDRYFTSVHDMGFSPERGNRYAYSVGTGTLENRAVSPAVKAATDTGIQVDIFKYTTATPITALTGGGAPTFTNPGTTPPAAWPGGVLGQCPTCEFSGFAGGNIDNETTGLDQWYISSADSTCTPFQSSQDIVPAGQPENNYNDVTSD